MNPTNLFKNILFLTLFLPAILASCTPQPGENNILTTKNPASVESMYPRLFTDNTGTVFMGWMEQSGNLYTLKYASFGDDDWSEAQTIATDSTWFVNWADFPAFIARDGKPLAAHWLNKVPGGTYAYHVNMATFGGNWLGAFTPHNDNTPTEHGFLSMTPASDSTFAALWLDGRQTHDRAHDEYDDIEKAMTLRGAIIDKKGMVKERFLIDESVCDCCNTAIAKTNTGFIAAYRNRTGDEIRDIYISRFEDGAWTEGKPVHADNWNIAACPVNGPAIDASGETVAVAWFTGANDKPKTKLAISDDGGESFHSPILLEESNTQGRVDLHISQDKIWVSWVSTNNENGALKIESYDFDGNKLNAHQLDDISTERSAGFPQITSYRDGVIIAFTDVSGDEPRVKTLVMN
ncbi:hypothetical protein [Gracilimonas mengyeensis]|uniref:BNR repeat-like domain-containing protein n=1 Tax=Gracilimonas mengyeensis TaxID=1302730 RepID=A0A521AJM3_9BACT|nr:hypothetical protein [Gracilimonas mengyeensis]SMO34967.1 hypothetical protein SAMN06265219_101191 [Gracilimonas mengyeensis]